MIMKMITKKLEKDNIQSFRKKVKEFIPRFLGRIMVAYTLRTPTSSPAKVCIGVLMLQGSQGSLPLLSFVFQPRKALLHARDSNEP